MTQSFVEIKMEVQAERAMKRLKAAGDLAAPYVYAALRRAMFDYRRTFVRGAHKSNPVKFGGGRNGFRAPAKANAPAGRNGFVVRTKPSNERKLKMDDIEVKFDTTSEIAAILEYGGTARPKRGKWLTIPIGVARKPDGKVRRYWSSPSVLKKYSSHVETRFVQRRGSRTAVVLVDVANRTGTAKSRRQPKTAAGQQRKRKPRARVAKPSRWRPAWLLVRTATTPAKLGFYDGWRKLGPNLVRAKVVAEFKNYMREVWGGKR